MATEKENKKMDFNLNLKNMEEAGLFFGHKTSKIHPKMKPYLQGVKNGVHLIDLEKTKEKFEEALEYIEKITKEEKTLLLVGTKIQFKDLVKEIAKEAEIPYIVRRWLGGTFTNFKTIRERINHFKELEEKKQKGEFDKYTKKERLDIDKEIKNLEEKFGGIKNMEGLPEAILVLDIRKDGLAIKEAEKKGVKIIAIADTNVDPTLADYAIPGNDDAISSVKYILEKVKEVIIKNKKTK